MMLGKIVVMGVLLSLPATGFSADLANGKTLHDTRCYQCHDTKVYTRPEHRIKDFYALMKQVDRCHAVTGLKWSKQDIEDVVGYLNITFYRFDQAR